MQMLRGNPLFVSSKIPLDTKSFARKWLHKKTSSNFMHQRQKKHQITFAMLVNILFPQLNELHFQPQKIPLNPKKASKKR